MPRTTPTTWGVYLWSDALGVHQPTGAPAVHWRGDVQARSARDAVRIAARTWVTSGQPDVGVLDAHVWPGGGPRPEDDGEYLDVTPPRMGGPTLPASERRTHHVRMPVSPAERAVLDAWAAREGRPLAELLRDRGLRAAKKSEPRRGPSVVFDWSTPDQPPGDADGPGVSWPERGEFRPHRPGPPRDDVTVLPWQEPPKRKRRA